MLTLIVSCRSRENEKTAYRGSLRNRQSLRDNSSLDRSNRSNNSYNSSYDAGKRTGKISIRTGAKPAWIDGEDSNYPRSRYLIAVGYAKHSTDAATRKSAEQATRAEMSQIFNTAIKASTKTIKRARAIRENKQLKGNVVTLESEKMIKNDTESRFFGMMLVDYWKDSDGTLYVLGVIDKTVVIPLLNDKIDDLDELINGAAEAAGNSEDPIERGKLLYKAMDKAIIREYYVQQLAIMDAKAPKTPYTVDILADMIDQNLGSMKVAVVIDGAGGREFKNVILNIGTSIGLQIDVQYKDAAASKQDFEDFGIDEDVKKSDYGSDADILIRGTVSYKALDRGDNHKWVIGTITLTLENKKINKIYKAFTISRREGAFSLPDAKRKASINLAKKLRKKLKKKLKKAISGL